MDGVHACQLKDNGMADLGPATGGEEGDIRLHRRTNCPRHVGACNMCCVTCACGTAVP